MTKDEAIALFDRQYEILDQIQDLLDEVNKLQPDIDRAYKIGYQPQHQIDDGIPLADMATGGAYVVEYDVDAVRPRMAGRN